MSIVAEMLGCRYPILQGAMGIISNPELVAAVSAAGGFGLLATGFMEHPEKLEREITLTRRLTDKPFGANLQVMSSLCSEFIEILAKAGIRAVTISGGLPTGIIKMLKARNMIAMVLAPNANLAKKAETLGADAVIASGIEAGGIQGCNGVSTMVLVPCVADAVKIPVIAAGGIGDSRGYRAALALGAKGVQVGTRFIASTECIAHARYKQMIVQSKEDDTGMSDFGMFRVRVINRADDKRRLSGTQAGQKLFSIQDLNAAWIDGKLDRAIVSSGSVSGIIHQVASVKGIIEEMVQKK